MSNFMVYVFVILLATFLVLDLAADWFGFAPTFSQRIELWGHEYPVIRSLYIFGAVVLYHHFWGR
jgi:hypothetical protein